MELEELRKQRNEINSRYDNAIINMGTLSKESTRVADIAYNAGAILDDLDREFEKKTGLNGSDISFLFLATALQGLRIYVLNSITKREKATKIKNEDGSYTLEGKIDKKEKKILNYFDDGTQSKPKLYYAPINQIISNIKVPYDCTQISEKGSGFFQNANHRFSTLGHDPILGLFFGTSNILTNTISITEAPIPGVFTYHVSYETTMKKGKINIGSPCILYGEGQLASTIKMCMAVKERFYNDKNSFVAALVKQIFHIGTDMYTKKGIQFPGVSMVLTPKQTEQLTKYIDWGTTVNMGVASSMAEIINGTISVLHNLMYSDEMGISRDIYNVRTKKIIMYSNTMASVSNVISTGVKMAQGNALAIKDLDIGGIAVTLHHLIDDPKFIRKVKEEFVLGSFDKMIEGEELPLLEV